MNETYEAVKALLVNADIYPTTGAIVIPWERGGHDGHIWITDNDGCSPKPDERVVVGFYEVINEEPQEEPYYLVTLPANWTDEELVRLLDDATEEVSR
jgi:hypothetical protein